MSEIIRTYYLPWLKIVSIVFGISLFIGFILKLVASQDLNLFELVIRTLVTWVSLVLLITILLGGILQYENQYHRPKRRLKLLKRSQLKELEKVNFKIDLENCCYSGMYKNYSIAITPDWDTEIGDVLSINAFILPKEENLIVLENLHKSYQLYYLDDITTIETSVKFSTSKIGFSEIINKMDELIAYLQINNLEPLAVIEE